MENPLGSNRIPMGWLMIGLIFTYHKLIPMVKIKLYIYRIYMYNIYHFVSRFILSVMGMFFGYVTTH